MSKQRRRRMVAGTGMSLGASLITGATAHAAVYEVDNNTDNGLLSDCVDAVDDDCSLRGAFVKTNGGDDYDSIYFSSDLSGSTITLTGGELIVSASVYIYGPNGTGLTINGNGGGRIIDINIADTNYDTVNIYDLRFTGGSVADQGGAIQNANANLNIFNSHFTDNHATGAGGDGGAIADDGGGLDVVNSTLNGNTAAGDGGAIIATGGGGIYNSTVTGNNAGDDGGAAASAYYIYAENSTISHNTAVGSGGGLYVDPLSIGSSSLLSSILSDNTAASGADVSGTADSAFSLIESPAGATLTGFSNITGQDPQLGALQANGGSTLTRRPAATSPVVDKGVQNSDDDQRGLPRRVDIPWVTNAAGGGDGTDIGAVELTLAEGPPNPGPGATTTSPPAKKKKKCKRKQKIAPGKKKCKKKKKK